MKHRKIKGKECVGSCDIQRFDVIAATSEPSIVDEISGFHHGQNSFESSRRNIPKKSPFFGIFCWVCRMTKRDLEFKSSQVSHAQTASCEKRQLPEDSYRSALKCETVDVKSFLKHSKKKSSKVSSCS